MTPAAFKRSIRDLQVWCSSCMVAFAGSDPIGVLIGAKRPSGTLVHRIARPSRSSAAGARPAPAHVARLEAGDSRSAANRRRSPRDAAPRRAGCSAPADTSQEAQLTDYVAASVTRTVSASRRKTAGRDPRHPRRSGRQRPARRGRPAGLLGAFGRDPDGEEGRHRRARRRLGGAHRGVSPVCERRRDRGAPLVRRGRGIPPEAAALPAPRVRRADHEGLEGPPGGDPDRISWSRSGSAAPAAHRRYAATARSA